MTNKTQNQAERTNVSSCLVIGGGISGLIAARILQNKGIKVTVIDKGRGIGGRLATRRVSSPDEGKGIFDYGAQHFQVTDPKFQKIVDTWLKVGLVEQWSNGFYTADEHFQNSDQVFYRGVESNRSIAKYLAKDLDVRTQKRIIELQWNNHQWIVNSQQGDSFSGKNLLITAPVPQSLDLLDNSSIEVPSKLRNDLEKLTYSRCFAVLAFLDKPSQIPEPGGLWFNGKILTWIASNYKKGISPEADAVTLHGSPEFSLTNWEADRDTIAQKLIDVAQPWLGSKVVSYQVHGWKFSQPNTYYGQPYAVLKEPGTLVLAGDAFSPQRNMEGAVLSGISAGEYIITTTSF